jgi:hypothetical protein
LIEEKEKQEHMILEACSLKPNPFFHFQCNITSNVDIEDGKIILLVVEILSCTGYK